MRKLRFKKPKLSQRAKTISLTVLILLAALFAANLDYPNYWNRFSDWTEENVSWLNVPKFGEREYSLGLDLQGGVHLVYEVDLSDIETSDKSDAVGALRDTIERRVNFLGVSEPVVQTQESEDGGARLIVELAGIQDPALAIEQIGLTPFLEFKEPRDSKEQIQLVKQTLPDLEDSEAANACFNAEFVTILLSLNQTGEDPCFLSTGLTGRYLERASVVTHPQTSELQVSIQFNSEGADLFAQITKRNIGKTTAIYLDGAPVSIPTVNEEIVGGQAVISGSFTVEEARDLASNLNSGALPVPIELISQQRVGASLGEKSLDDSLFAALFGVIAVLLFLVIVYRFSGFMAAISLLVYLVFLLAIIKLIPVTLTLAGIAGLILSIGMAVDANVLVFERLKEEMTDDTENIARAIDRAFLRAWPSIRDGNFSTFFTALILFWFSTSFVQGFALTLGLGILVSLFSAMVVTKLLLKSFASGRLGKFKKIWTR